MKKIYIVSAVGHTNVMKMHKKSVNLRPKDKGSVRYFIGGNLPGI